MLQYLRRLGLAYSMGDLRNGVDVGHRRKLAESDRDRSTDRVRDVAGPVDETTVGARCSPEPLVREHKLIVCIALRRRTGGERQWRASPGRPDEGGCRSRTTCGGDPGRIVTGHPAPMGYMKEHPQGGSWSDAAQASRRRTVLDGVV